FLMQSSRRPIAPEEVERLEKELAEANEKLERLTHVDLLTGVLNKRGLEHILHAEESRMGRSGSHLVAVLVNCDNFALVNDAVGEADGDLILKDVARRIVGTLRPSDHVARTGGDEFLVLLPDTQLPFGVKVAERIRAAVRERQHYNLPSDLEVTVSLGVATIPSEVETVEQAISVARMALDRSKTSGKNRVALGRGGGSALLDLTPEELVKRLRDVDTYETVFLPVIDLISEEVVGYEVLTRGPNGAFDSPADMFRLCVENDVLTEVDLHCLRLGIEKSKEVAPNMRVHFNIFPSTILETPIDELVALFPNERKGQTFWIELSEQNIVGDPSNFRHHVSKLRDAGVLVAVDDIGFSRQSLETLMLLEPDAVKVDRTYVSGVSKDKAKIRLLTRLVNVAKSLGSEVIAEGVENAEEIPILKQLGIHLAQGFFFGDLMDILPEESAQRKLRK
ncbi:MAG: EAL domain-containing protein, partial [Cyanobacteria bacterium]|nr:EAL domain-containing protein [Cyanobacteriota bacterium]